MAPTRYSIYSSDALEKALSERMPRGDPDAGLRSRSSTITAMVERYAETCRRSMPKLPLNSWLLIFDAMNGCWLMDHPAMVANGLPHNVHDHIHLNDAAAKWHVEDPDRLVAQLAGMTFAEQIAVVDACERFWAMDIQTSGDDPTETDPFAHWRWSIQVLVGAVNVQPKPAEDHP